ncbi:MAG: peroxiredoxin family protein [Solirubrobacteraceae bacterium]
MATKEQRKQQVRAERRRKEAEAVRAARARTLRLRLLGAVGAAVAVLAVVFAISATGSRPTSPATKADRAGQFAFAVGNPGPGASAPAIRLPSTTGETYDLAKRRGTTVLLYFQEGLGCQPCWDQIKDVEKRPELLRSLGIDEMVSITTNDLENLRQKARDEGIRTQVLADPDLAVSEAYAANQYGMMGTSADGHSFIVVGPDGEIRHRADYGGAPNYTMYVPVENLVADMRAGLRGSAGA